MDSMVQARNSHRVISSIFTVGILLKVGKIIKQFHSFKHNIIKKKSLTSLHDDKY